MKTRNTLALQAALIALAGWWVFSPSLRGTWLWDDDLYITRNLALRSPAGLWKIWFAPPGVNYFPVTFTVQWLQWHLWGDDPLGYHLTNVALHLLSSFLLWRLFRKIGLRLAWLGGLLFAVHPVTVESVAWISELKNTLSLPPLFLAMCSYIDYDAGKARSDYWIALLWFIGAMLCKSTVAMFPAVLLLHAWWKHGRIGKADLAASAAFFAASLVLGLISVSFEHRWTMVGFDDTPIHRPSSRAAAAGLAVVFYFSKCCFPAGLLPTYPRWNLHPVSPGQFLPWAALAALFSWSWSKRGAWGRHALFGFGAFAITLIPILGFVPMSYQRISWVADHFAYIPLAALIGLPVAGFGVLHRRLAAGGSREVQARKLPPPLILAWSGAIAIVAVLAWNSHGYAAIFMNRSAFWSYTLRHNPNSWAAHNDLGTGLVRDNRPAEAIAEFDEAIRLEPSSAVAHNNLGAALAKLGRFREAIAEYEQVLRLGAGYSGVHYNLAMALARTGRLSEAIDHYETALQLRPDYPEAENNLGLALAATGRTREAIGHYERALRLEAEYPEAGNNLGATLLATGRTKEGISRLEETLHLKPDYVEARANLAFGLVKNNQITDAISQYREILRSQPHFPGINSRLGDALAEAGRLREAAASYREGLRQNPADEAAGHNLELVLRALEEDREGAGQERRSEPP